MARYENFIVTKEFLDKHEFAMFVFGDNTLHKGYGGAAILRDHKRAYGFITKVFPSNNPESFFTVEDYQKVFFSELDLLDISINRHPEMTWYISQLGAGLANRHKIWENLIKENLEKRLSKYKNVVFLWDESNN